MTPRYFAFKSPTSGTMYGFGTRSEAREYCAYLNTEGPNDNYKIVPVYDPMRINGVEFDIGYELTSIRGIS